MISVIFQKRIHFSVCPAALKGIEANRINTVENSFFDRAPLNIQNIFGNEEFF